MLVDDVSVGSIVLIVYAILSSLRWKAAKPSGINTEGIRGEEPFFDKVPTDFFRGGWGVKEGRGPWLLSPRKGLFPYLRQNGMSHVVLP